MADDAELSCFIEGTKHPFDIIIPHNSKGDSLKENIFNRRCKELAPDCDHLVLLKANVDRHCPRLPLLRFNLGDEGVTEISPRQMISEIWQVPPPSGRIHIFVTFTNLPSEFEGRRRLLEAAHLVYYTFWGKDLNKLLQLVPECGNFRYLTEEQIHKLGIRGPLGYSEVVLLVRKAYEDAYSELQSYQSKPEESRGGGVVVLGQSGITSHRLRFSPLTIATRSRKNMFPVLSPISPLKRGKGCRFSKGSTICSLYRNRCSDMRIY
ncbi:hypothetical protein EDB92DRAFT_2846 [Lactarius akahatsu]|uniref:Crinkler effector protein N-terminal domain-containing protein n=1 Tax=Lactarius akahatsu TaxID=416441 RepID=A0AAD4QHW5_9AGAM|nr:hypothetical protein EDB92DRAFT_2846 [Lactarius akahatsu]